MKVKVTTENWRELQARGYRHLTNTRGDAADLGPLPEVPPEGDYLTVLYNQYGEDLLFGDALNPETGLPDAEFSGRTSQCGIYAPRANNS